MPPPEPPPHPSPPLPLDVLDAVLSFLPRSSLAVAARVNSAFLVHVLPLLYAHLVFHPDRQWPVVGTRANGPAQHMIQRVVERPLTQLTRRIDVFPHDPWGPCRHLVAHPSFPNLDVLRLYVDNPFRVDRGGTQGHAATIHSAIRIAPCSAVYTPATLVLRGLGHPTKALMPDLAGAFAGNTFTKRCVCVFESGLSEPTSSALPSQFTPSAPQASLRPGRLIPLAEGLPRAAEQLTIILRSPLTDLEGDKFNLWRYFAEVKDSIGRLILDAVLPPGRSLSVTVVNTAWHPPDTAPREGPKEESDAIIDALVEQQMLEAPPLADVAHSAQSSLRQLLRDRVRFLSVPEYIAVEPWWEVFDQDEVAQAGPEPAIRSRALDR